MGSAIVYRRYPWASTWDDITSLLSVSDFDIEERVNGAGICTLSVGNARRWAERAMWPGMQLKVYLKSVSGQLYDRPDFEGYIPPDFQRTVIGIESGMEIPIVGYYDLFGRTQNERLHVENHNNISVMAMMNGQVKRATGETYMNFAGQMNEYATPFYLNTLKDAKGTCRSIVEELRKKMIDDSDAIFPCFFHLLTTPVEGSKPLLSLRKEPNINGTPQLTIEEGQILNVDSDKTNTMLTSTIIGGEEWNLRYSNENFVDKFFQVDRDIRSKENGGYVSSYNKSIELLKNKYLGRSLTVRLSGIQQIPLLSLIAFNSNEEELQGNSIVYGRRVSRSGSIQTELLCRNLPNNILA